MTTRRSAKRPTFISLFCGCGGLDLGFEQSGFRGLAAFDLDEDAISTRIRNSDTPTHKSDLSQISDVSTLQIPRSPDVVLAGPPCQGFSTIGTRRHDDPRNSLLPTAATLAVMLTPKVVLIENVAGVMSGSHRTYWEQAITILAAAGYSHRTISCVGSQLGLAQSRKRVFLVAWSTGASAFPDLPIAPSSRVLADVIAKVDGLPNHDPLSLADGSRDHAIAVRIGQDQRLSNVRGGHRSIRTWSIPEVFGRTNHHERTVLEALSVIRRRARLRDTGDADPVTLAQIATYAGHRSHRSVATLCKKGYLRKVGTRYDLTSTFNGKYWRLAWNNAAPTVHTRFGQPRYFLHPEEHRGFSVREAARIQGFPDNFAFLGNIESQFRQVGNAVPPPIAQQIAANIIMPLLRS